MKAGESQSKSHKRYAPLSKATPRIATPSFWVYDQNPAQLLLQVHEPERRSNPRPFSRRFSVHNYAPQRCLALDIAHLSLSVHDQDRHSSPAALRGEAGVSRSTATLVGTTQTVATYSSAIVLGFRLKPCPPSAALRGEAGEHQSVVAQDNPQPHTAEHCCPTPSSAPTNNGAPIPFGVNP